MSLHIDEETEVTEEVGSINGLMDIHNYENPLKDAVEADIESEGVFPESWDGSVVDGPFLS